jgi:hypothetical protein
MAGVHPSRAARARSRRDHRRRSRQLRAFAAPAIHHGFPENHAYTSARCWVRIVCAEPYGGKGGRARRDPINDVKVTALHPAQRCRHVGRRHAMYERSNPFFEHVAGGTPTWQMHVSSRSPRRRRGSPARASAPVSRQAEGAGKVGERYVGMVDPRPAHDRARRRSDDWARRVRGGSGRRRRRYQLLHGLWPQRRDGGWSPATSGARALHSVQGIARPRRWPRRFA